jgi:hypothetical protein
MGKGKIILFLSCFVIWNASAQNDDYIGPGLLATTLTISPSWMLNRADVNYNLTGFLEGYLDKRISVRGETHYFVGGQNDNPYIKFNSRTLFGVQYHINNNNLDGHVGMLPGISLMKINGDINIEGNNTLHIVPTLGLKVGVSYFVGKIFQFFADVTYVRSTAIRTNGFSGKSDELLLSLGLGYNINKKQKETLVE